MKYVLALASLLSTVAYAQSVITINNAGSCTSSGTPTALVLNCTNVPVPPIPPTGSVTATCGGFGYTVVGGGAVTLPFTTPKAGNASYGDTQAWVFSLTVPAGTPDSTSHGSMTVVGNGGNEFWKNGIVSLTPCDFNGKTTPVLDACRNTPTCGVTFMVKQTGSAGSSVATLVPGQTYYISYRNWSDFISPSGGGTCGAGLSCPQTYSYQNAR